MIILPHNHITIGTAAASTTAIAIVIVIVMANATILIFTNKIISPNDSMGVFDENLLEISSTN